jgi:hypothetical protein
MLKSKKSTKPKKTKTYLVPAVVHGTFGVELEVEATSAEEAKAKVRAGEGRNDDGYDWNRWSETKQTVGNWTRITIVQ